MPPKRKPPSPTTGASIKESPTFYAGTTKYEIVDGDSKLSRIKQYITFVLSYMGDERMDLESILSQAPTLIGNAFIAILQYNNIPINLPLRMVCSNEPAHVDFVYYDNRENILYMSINAITNYLKEPTQPVSVIQDLCESTTTTQYPTAPDGEVFADQYVMLRILSIADHLATHYVELCQTGKTDWINHHEFGRRTPNHILLHTCFSVSVNAAAQGFGLVRKNPISYVVNDISVRAPGFLDPQSMFAPFMTDGFSDCA